MVHISSVGLYNLLLKNYLSSCDILALLLHLVTTHAKSTNNPHSAYLSTILLSTTIHCLSTHFLHSVPNMLSLPSDSHLLMVLNSMLVTPLSNTSLILNLPFLISCMLLFFQNLDSH